MNSFKGVSRNHTKIKRGLLLTALGCFLSANGFGQLIYLTDARSVSGSAAVNNVSQYNSPPYYTTSYSGDYSGSAAPNSPFADFMGSVNGSANFQGGVMNSGQQTPINITSTANASQTSFLHSQELYFSGSESTSGSPGSFGQPSSQWSADGSSSLQVSFEVLIPVKFNLMVQGTGDPFTSSDDFSLSSSSQGVLFSGNTTTMLQRNQYGTSLDFSSTFLPGNTYTFTLDSQGNLDGGGLMADLSVPEPSMTALAGLAFLIFLFRVRKISQESLAMEPVKVPRDEGRGSRRVR